MENTISSEEKILFKIFENLVNGRKLPDNLNADWDVIFKIANKHCVLPLLYDILQNQDLSPDQINELNDITSYTVIKNYHLYFLTRFLLNKLSEAKIPVVVIKGISVSKIYPVPEYRKSSDIDLLLLDETKLKVADKLLTDLGLLPYTSEADHHKCWLTPDNIMIEFHTMLIEPGKNQVFNKCFKNQLNKLNGQYSICNIGGSDFQVLPDGFQAYELLLHMLHHFLREGFGLKLLLDWTLFWNNPVSDKAIDQYLSLVHEIHLENFSKVITSVCYRYFGLQGCANGIYVKNGKFVYAEGEFCELLPESDIELFLKDLLDGGEFGTNAVNNYRLVTMKSSGIKGYVSEFHYAMRRKFPKAGKCVFIWPALWIATFIIFAKENRLKGRNGLAVIKEASSRTKIIENLNLFK